MRLTSVVLVMMFCVTLVCTVQSGFKSLYERNEIANRYMRNAYAEKFIGESFRNTCNDCGFDSLNEWQVTCRAMCNLDYIGWADACEFMEVSYALCDKKLMYGKWNGTELDGEVYCRNNRSMK